MTQIVIEIGRLGLEILGAIFLYYIIVLGIERGWHRYEKKKELNSITHPHDFSKPPTITTTTVHGEDGYDYTTVEMSFPPKGKGK